MTNDHLLLVAIKTRPKSTATPAANRVLRNPAARFWIPTAPNDFLAVSELPRCLLLSMVLSGFLKAPRSNQNGRPWIFIALPNARGGSKI